MTALEGLENTPVVSVIVPTYNRAYCLPQTIQSVLDQTFFDWELILVDNYSTDGTDGLVGSYSDPRIKYLKIHNGGVVAASRNKGIKAATGKYLAFLDSDDWWASQKLEKSLEALEAGADFVYHDLYIVSSLPTKSTQIKRIRSRQVLKPVFRDLLINGPAICNSSVIVRRELMEKIGGFSEDEQLVAAEDYEAWLRVSKLVDTFVLLPNCLGYYTLGVHNLSSAAHTITYVHKILELYGNEIPLDSGGVPGWINYSLASSFYKKKLFKKSKLHAIRTICGSANLAQKVRSIAILILVLLKPLFGKN